jgi:hypothetical protein
MAEFEVPKLTDAIFDQQLASLRDAAATSIDPCVVAKFIALTDPRVRELFFKKFADGYLFRGISCVQRIGIPENKYVLFDFDCIPGTVCFVPPAFLVVVNIVERNVVSIIDAYTPSSVSAAAASACGCEEPTSYASRTLQTLSDCVSLTVGNGKVCLSIPYAGEVCVSVPGSVPNGTVAEACVDTCKKFGVLCGAKVTVRVAGIQVACQSWGCCDC